MHVKGKREAFDAYEFIKLNEANTRLDDSPVNVLRTYSEMSGIKSVPLVIPAVIIGGVLGCGLGV